MRPYRGKTKEGKLVKGDLITEGSRAFIFSKDRKDGWLFEYDNFGRAILYRNLFVEVIPSTVGQSTGRKDKNEKEIYGSIWIDGKLTKGGDTIKFTYWWFDGAERETELIGTIVYSPELMSFQLKGVKNEEWERFTGYENDTEYLTSFSELNFSEADFEIIHNKETP